MSCADSGKLPKPACAQIMRRRSVSPQFALSFADASYRFEIEVQSYTNPISRNAYDMCCSPSDQEDCRTECNNAFLFCVREGGHQRDLQDCPLGTWWTSRIGGDAISFVPGQNIDNGVPNPLVVRGESWPVSIGSVSGVNRLYAEL